ncbi:MAG: M23 family metallopeptidase, partial [Desulfatiglandales bacterium]
STHHHGIDVAAPLNTKVVAVHDGVVKYMAWNGGYGKTIRIEHNLNGQTYTTQYAHLNKYKKGLKRGDIVMRGEVIGYVGSTGVSTGNHLDFEVRSLHESSDIDPYLDPVAFFSSDLDIKMSPPR